MSEPTPPQAGGLRIAACLSHFHPTVGGAERQLFQLARHWSNRGHTTRVLTRALPGLPARELVEGIDIQRCIRPVSLGPLFGAGFLWTLTRTLARSRCDWDVVLAAQAPWEAVAAGWAAGRWNKPAVIRLANTGTDGDLRQLEAARGSAYWRKLVLRSSAFVAVSSEARDELLAFGCPEDRIHLLPNGVDTETFRPSPDGWHAERARQVVFIGRLAPQKEPGLLLDAWREVNGAGKGTLHMVGDGPLSNEIRERSMRDPVLARSVRWHGRLTDVRSLLHQCGILVLPSRSEGCSNALLEAMACGLCPVVSDIRGNTDVVAADATGVVFRQGQTPALAAALGRVLGNSTEQERLGSAAREHVARSYDLRTIASRYLDLFRSLVREQGPP